jgi:hypothetical protein
MSEPARLTGVYFSPGAAMADVAARPQRWWIPLILFIVVQMVYMNLYGSRVGWERTVRQQIESSSRYEQMTPEQREQGLRMGVKMAGIMSYGGVAIGVPVVALVMAGVLMFALNLMGSKSSFKQSFSIVAYSMMIGVLVQLLAIGVMFLKNPEDFDIRNPLAFNAGALVSSTAPKWLASLAGSLDVFSFWSMAVLAFGYAATSKKMTWGKAFCGILALWAVYVVGKTGWVAMFG